MSKQMVTCVLLWTFVLLRIAVPVVGDLNSGTRCTVQDSELRNELMSIATCSDHGATVSFNSIINTQETSVDYVCIGEGGETITGAPWDRRTSPPGVRYTVAVTEQLQPGMNCTFYVCYKYYLLNPYRSYTGRESPISCITDIDECATNNGGCEQTCINTIGSFNCSCGTGYQLDVNRFNCSDVNECENGDHNCSENANCTNTEGSFTCSCNPGYTGDGVGCTNIDECSLGAHACDPNANCTDTDGSFNCACINGFEGNGFNCTDIPECDRGLDECDMNATCFNTFGSYDCMCNTGFTGDGFTCADIDECGTGMNDCHVNATCNNSFGSFGCACEAGFEGNGANCSNTNECELANDNCHTHANCTDTIGSFVCTCVRGFEGDGVNCTNVDECNTGNGGCEHNCTDTIGSFQCSCDIGYLPDGNGLNCSAPTSAPDPGEATMIAVLSVVVATALLVAVLCVAICAVHQFRQKDTMFEISFKDEVIDLKYYPVSTDIIPKLHTVSSVPSLFDNLCTIPEHISDIDTGSSSETQAADQHNELLDIVLHQGDTADGSSPNDIVTSGETTAGNADARSVDLPVPNDTANVPFSATGAGISATSYINEGKEELYSNLNLERDAQIDGTELAFSNPISDVHAVGYTSVINLSSVISEDLLVGNHKPICTFDLDDHVSETEPFQSVGLETESHGEQSFTFSAEEARNQEFFHSNELQSHPGYLPNTDLLSSVGRNLDALSCQRSVSPSVNRRDGLRTGMTSPPRLSSTSPPRLSSTSPPRLSSPSSPHHCRTPSESSLDYFDTIMHSQINDSKMQYVSASSGYITDSRTGESGLSLPSATANFPFQNELPIFNEAD